MTSITNLQPTRSFRASKKGVQTIHIYFTFLDGITSEIKQEIDKKKCKRIRVCAHPTKIARWDEQKLKKNNVNNVSYVQWNIKNMLNQYYHSSLFGIFHRLFSVLLIHFLQCFLSLFSVSQWYRGLLNSIFYSFWDRVCEETLKKLMEKAKQ